MILNSLFLLLTGCAAKKHVLVAPDHYLNLNKQHAAKHKICIEQKKQVLNRAITRTEQAELNDENFFFVRDEKKALDYINKFDISKFANFESQLENRAIIGACVLKKDKDYKSCDSMMAAYEYFRGMIYGLRQYSWSGQTSESAISQTLSYLKYVTTNDPSLMDIILVNDLLMRLADQGSVKGELYSRAIGFRHDAEKLHKDLRKKMRKLAKKEVNCKDVQEFHEYERKEVKDLSEDFSKILEDAT